MIYAISHEWKNIYSKKIKRLIDLCLRFVFPKKPHESLGTFTIIYIQILYKSGSISA